jgi:RNA polymerase sigma factor (sigma-70 family)
VTEIDVAASSFDTVNAYLREIGRRPLLTKDQEYELGTRVQAGIAATQRLADPAVTFSLAERKPLDAAVADGEEARVVFVESNLRLVVSVARRHSLRESVPMMDLVQEGAVGLMRAVEKFAPDRGFKFSTYATYWIKQTMSRGGVAQRANIRIPHQSHDRQMSVLRARKELGRWLYRPPTVDEVCEYTGFSVALINEIDAYPDSTISYDVEVSEGGDATFQDLLADPLSGGAIDEFVDTQAAKAKVREAFAVLNNAERAMVCAHYGFVTGEPMKYAAVAVMFDVSEGTARNMIDRACCKMSHPSLQLR